ncbi:LOW QUALITY PROTEIN: hypothetical protein Syun_020109 [Stephania yunnanensis]|uniref:Pentatricopeptide repeat-containing protein n=1 Tax=Stephania yunnanensis TaxID=152371 RepID=A0AAP0IEL4_9MAGN
MRSASYQHLCRWRVESGSGGRQAEMHQIFHLINSTNTLEQLKQVHAQTITSGFLSLHPCLVLSRILHAFTLLSLPPNSLSYASLIFNQIPTPSTFSYNTIIRAHTLLSSPLSALLLFIRMRRSSIPPDSHTFPFALKACATSPRPLLSLARSLHSQSLAFGFGDHIFLRNALIHFYSISPNSFPDARRLFHETRQPDVVSYNSLLRGFIKAGEVLAARHLFDQMPIKDTVSWATLLSGYSQMNHCKQAIELLHDMLSFPTLKPDNVALVSALSACAQLGALQMGEFIHNYVKLNGITVDSFMSTALVDMYSKCGRVDIATEIFEASQHKNLFTWNAIIVGLAMNGHAELSFQVLHEDERIGCAAGCSDLLRGLAGIHSGFLVKARELFFHEMESVYGVHRELKHYGCMADLLGRAGLTEEIVEMIEGMPMEGDVFVWSGLLNGCRIRGNVELAEVAAKHIMELDPKDGGVYSIMTAIYANAKRWEDVANVRRLMNVVGINKNAGCSTIEIDGTTHEFIAGDTLHPQVDDIYLVLDGIGRQKFQCNGNASSDSF